MGQHHAGRPSRFGDGAEQGPLAPGAIGSGPIEITGAVPVEAPGLQGGDRAEQGLGWIGPDGDVLALAVLVSFRAAHQNPQTAVRHRADIARRQRHEF